MRSILLATACVVVLALVSATPCLAQAAKKGEKAADSLKALAKTVEQGEAQVTATTSALNQLCNKANRDLRKPFKAYEKAVKKLSSLAAEARKRREGLEKNRDAYLAAWDQDIAAIQHEDLKMRSLERREQVQKELQNLATLATAVGENYRKYEALLLDIQKVAGADLTQGGIQSVASTANQARASAVALRDSISSLRKELQSLGVALSAKAAK